MGEEGACQAMAMLLYGSMGVDVMAAIKRLPNDAPLGKHSLIAAQWRSAPSFYFCACDDLYQRCSQTIVIMRMRSQER